MNPSGRTHADLLPRDQTTVLMVTALDGLLATFWGSSVNMALPRIGPEFQASTVTLSWVSLTHILAAGAVLMPVGPLADLHGRKRPFLWGTLKFVLTGLIELGFAFLASPMIHSVMDRVDRSHRGDASATRGTMRLAGQNISAARPQTSAVEGASP